MKNSPFGKISKYHFFLLMKICSVSEQPAPLARLDSSAESVASSGASTVVVMRASAHEMSATASIDSGVVMYSPLVWPAASRDVDIGGGPSPVQPLPLSSSAVALEMDSAVAAAGTARSETRNSSARAGAVVDAEKEWSLCRRNCSRSK